jgi:hypothetical protein
MAATDTTRTQMGTVEEELLTVEQVQEPAKAEYLRTSSRGKVTTNKMENDFE